MTVAVFGSCEMTVGFSRQGPRPYIIRCGKVATLVRGALKPFGTWMCSEHQEQWKTRRTVG